MCRALLTGLICCLALAACGDDDESAKKAPTTTAGPQLTAAGTRACFADGSQVVAPLTDKALYWELAQEAERTGGGQFNVSNPSMNVFFLASPGAARGALPELRRIEREKNGGYAAQTFTYHTAANALVIYTDFLDEGGPPPRALALAKKCLGRPTVQLPGTRPGTFPNR